MTRPALPSPAKVRQYVEAVRAASGREVAAVRTSPDGTIEVQLGGGNAVNPADLVRMDD